MCPTNYELPEFSGKMVFDKEWRGVSACGWFCQLWSSAIFITEGWWV